VHGHVPRFFADVGSFLDSSFPVHRFSLLYFLVSFFPCFHSLFCRVIFLSSSLHFFISCSIFAKSFFYQPPVVFCDLRFPSPNRKSCVFLCLFGYYVCFLYLPFSFVFPCFILYIYIHSFCRPSCCGQAGPDEAKEEEVEGEKEDEDRDYEGEEEEVEEGVDRLSNIQHRFNSCHLPWTPPLDVNLRHDVFATVLSTTSSTLSWNWSTIRSTPELPASISGSRPLSSNPSGYRTMAAASAMDFKSLARVD
jgi:hypothetical protein